MNFNLRQQIINTYHIDYKFFFSKPNVQGVGHGYKYVNNICTCEPAILVFVRKKISSNCLQSNGSIPPLYKGIKTDVIEAGNFNADYPNSNICNAIPFGNNSNRGVYTKKIRPVEPGYCVSILGDLQPHSLPKTGTLGYIATDDEQVSKTYCFLSNNITFANCNKVPIGSEIVQPAVEFGGHVTENVIAKLLRFITINFHNRVPDSLNDINNADGAVASFLNVGQVNLINPNIPQIGVPIGVSKVMARQPIQWTGCISGHNYGVIVADSCLIRVNYGTCGSAYFDDVIIARGQIVDPGDRGALACDFDKNAIGLIFASSDFHMAPLNVISDMKILQDKLKITLLTVNN